MKDQQLDDLLKDLNTALSIEPSPSVAARVRTRIEHEPAARPFDMRWMFVAAAAAVVVTVAYVVWALQPVRRTSEPQLASVPAETRPVTPALAPASVPKSGRRLEAVTRKVTPPNVEAEPSGPDLRVLISPRQQLGMAQLRAALRDGRVTEEALTPPPFPAPEAPIVITAAEIETFKVGQSSAPRAGGGGLFAKRSGK